MVKQLRWISTTCIIPKWSDHHKLYYHFIHQNSSIFKGNTKILHIEDITFSVPTKFGEGVIITWHYIFTPQNIWWVVIISWHYFFTLLEFGTGVDYISINSLPTFDSAEWRYEGQRVIDSVKRLLTVKVYLIIKWYMRTITSSITYTVGWKYHRGCENIVMIFSPWDEDIMAVKILSHTHYHLSLPISILVM